MRTVARWSTAADLFPQGEAHPNLLRGRDRHFGAKLADPGEAFREAVEAAVADRLAKQSDQEQGKEPESAASIRTRKTKDGENRYLGRVPARRPRDEDPLRRVVPDEAARDDPRRLRRGRAAALRVPHLRVERREPSAPTLAAAAERWQASRVDVAEATTVQHRTALNRALPVLGDRRSTRSRPATSPTSSPPSTATGRRASRSARP